MNNNKLLLTSAVVLSALAGGSVFADESVVDGDNPSVVVVPTEVADPTETVSEVTPIPSGLPVADTTVDEDSNLGNSTVDEITETPTPSELPEVVPTEVATGNNGDSTVTEAQRDITSPVSESSNSTSNSEDNKGEVVTHSNEQESHYVQESSTNHTIQEDTPISVENPVVTDSGYTIVGVIQDAVLVQKADGTIEAVTPEKVDAKTNADGTITVKTKEGESVTLPKSGSKETLAVSIIGFILLAMSFIVTDKKTSKNVNYKYL